MMKGLPSTLKKKRKKIKNMIVRTALDSQEKEGRRLRT
jgi:hypothetical protein